MRRIWSLLPIFGTSLLMAAPSLAAPPSQFAAAGASAAAPTAAPAAPAADEQQLRPLLDRLGELSRVIMDGDGKSPRAWEYHLEQAEVLLRIASLSRDRERENMLRMAVDDFRSAALLSPKGQTIAYARLQQLPRRMAQSFPGSPAVYYAVFQEIQADCTRVLNATGDNAKAEDHHCKRLIHFALSNPKVPEAAKAIFEAGRIRETLGQAEDASRCYRYLIQHYSKDAVAHKAEGALWRLGQHHEPIQLELPFLYASSSSKETTFNLNRLHGRTVVVYFWSSTAPHVAEDFESLKKFTDRNAGRGVEVVYVNMDADAKQGREFLSGKLTSGVHLYQAGGMDGVVAERYGIQEVPQVFLINKDGTLLRHSVAASEIEAAIANDAQQEH